MKCRLVIFSMVLLLSGLGTVKDVQAESALRWKSPRVGNNETSKETSKTPPLLLESGAEQKKNSVQQVRYLVPQGEMTPIEIGGGIPAETAKVDTVYPESRPNRQSTVQLPGPARQSGPLFDETTLRSPDSADEVPTFAPPRDSVRPPLVQMNCPDAGNTLKSLRNMDYSIKLKDQGPGPQECGLGDPTFQQRNWGRICFMWKASALAHKPAYFEDVALERYGHTYVREEFQPIVSGARFFLTIPILPYKMGINPPNECIYTLGYNRPGSCAPYILDPLPISVRGGLLQAGAIVGGVAVIP